jgi:transposase-like protein DUF772
LRLDDHLAWFVIDAVDTFDLGAFYADYRADGHGRPAHDPQMMVCLLLYAYANGTRTSRAIERRLIEDVAFPVIATGPAPDHPTSARTIARTTRPHCAREHERGRRWPSGTCGRCGRRGAVAQGPPDESPDEGRQPGHETTPAFKRARAPRLSTPARLRWTSVGQLKRTLTLPHRVAEASAARLRRTKRLRTAR